MISYSSMKVLITGGAGFLGLHLADFFCRKGNRVTLVDIADFDKKEYPSQCRFVKADVRDNRLIGKVMVGHDAVVHAAAALPLWPAKEIFSINVAGTRNLLELALKNKIKRFIYISSTAVYGVPKKHPIEENDALVGVGPYGQSKIEAEKACRFYRKKGLTVTVLRPKTFIGTHRLGVFEILFDWIKDGKKIPMIGNGNNRYQLLAVDDLVEVVYLLTTVKNKEKTNSEFNIGAEKFVSVKNDLQALFDYAASGSSILPTPAFLVKKALWLFEKLKISPLYQWVYDTADKDSYVSIEKLIKVLKWHPKYSNSEALIESYRWYLDNYQQIKSRPAGITHTAGWQQGILKLFKKIL